MKKTLIIILCFILFLTSFSSPFAYAIDKYTVTQYKDQESEDFLWETLNQYTDSQILAAAILGFFWRESYYKSDAIAHWATLDAQIQQDNSLIFTKEIDKGLSDGSTKNYFIEKAHNHFGGYGLGQWYSISYLSALYDFACEWGTSIADAEMQCAFAVWSIYNLQTKFLNNLNLNSIYDTSKWMSYIYDGSYSAYGVIYYKAKTIYKIKNAE